MSDERLQTSGDVYAKPRKLTELAEKVQQKLLIRFRRHRGADPHDRRLGFPYAEWSEIKPFPIRQFEDLTRREILGTSGVLYILELSVVENTTTRTVEVDGRIKLEDDAIVTFQVAVVPLDPTATRYTFYLI